MRSVPDFEFVDHLHYGDGQFGDLRVVVGVPLGQTGSTHIGVPDRLHLIRRQKKRGVTDNISPISLDI